MPSNGLLQRLLGFLQFGRIILLLACTKYEPVPHNAYTVKLGIKELLNREQISFKELFTIANSFIP